MCAVLCSIASVVSNSLWPMDCSLPSSSVHRILKARITRVGCHALLQGIVRTQESIAALFTIAKEPGNLDVRSWINKQNVVYTCNGILFSLKKKEILTCCTMDEPWGHYISEISQSQKDKNLYVAPSIVKFIESRMVVARCWRRRKWELHNEHRRPLNNAGVRNTNSPSRQKSEYTL